MGIKKQNDSKRNFYIPYQYNIIFQCYSKADKPYQRLENRSTMHAFILSKKDLKICLLQSVLKQKRFIFRKTNRFLVFYNTLLKKSMARCSFG